MKKMFWILLALPSLGACSVGDSYYSDPYYRYPRGAVAITDAPLPAVRARRHSAPAPVIEHRHGINQQHGHAVIPGRPDVHRPIVKRYPKPNDATNHAHGHD